MSKEVLEYLMIKEGPCRIIDGTVGYGGHSSLILGCNRRAEVLGIDRDSKALSCAREKLNFAANRIHLVRGNFSCLLEFAGRFGWDSVDGILLDLGVSSPQLDDPARGFSHRLDGPLDMRMDSRLPNTASRLLNNASIEELKRIFKDFGEIRKSGRLASAVVKRRRSQPFSRTLELAELCETILGKSPRGRKLPAPTLCFQALRIAVNNELEELRTGLNDAISLLGPGGRIAVISFHSLEDRIVKRNFRDAAADCLCDPKLPICVCGHKPILKIITKKALRPSEEEISTNRRASSAKLRVAEKLDLK